MGRIVLCLPIELIEEAGADDRQFVFVVCARAARDTCERKSEGQERKGKVAQNQHAKCGGMGIITCYVVRRE